MTARVQPPFRWEGKQNSHACSHLFVGMGDVKDQKANTSLTELWLNGNRVGDAGASALADALRATILTYMKCVFSSVSPQMLLHRAVCTVGVVNFFGSTRSGFCVIYLVSCLKTLTQVLWRRVRIELHYLTSELKRCRSPLTRAKLRCATESRHQESGGTLKITTVFWFDRHAMAKQNMAPRREKTTGTADTHRMLWPDRRRHDTSERSMISKLR